MSGGSAEARGAPPGRTHPPGRAIVDLDIQGQWRAGLVREPEDPGTGSPPRRHPHTPAMGRDLILSLKRHPRAPGLQKAESDGCRHCTSRLSPTAWQGPTVLPRALARPQAGGHRNAEKGTGWARTPAGSAAMVLCDLRHFIALSEPQ